MTRSALRWYAAVTITLSLGWHAIAAQPAESKLDQLLSHIAPEAQVIVAIPSLKRLNDDITELLGGMDRADMIAAGRPIDLAKSMLGLGGGIDDRRGAAFALVPGEDAMPATIILLPVVDPDAFLETNFKLDEASGAYVNSAGKPVYIRALGDNFMLLAESKNVVEHYKAGPGAREMLMQRFGDSAQPFFARGEVLIMLNQAGMQLGAMATLFGGGAFPGAAGKAEANPAFEALIEQVDGLAYAIDVDPLGVMVHGLLTFEPESDLAGALHHDSTAHTAWRNSLANKAYYVAAGADLKASGAIDVLDTMAAIFGVDMNTAHDVLAHASRISFIASPSPAGMTGGMLNDAALVMYSDDPAALHVAIHDAIDAFAARANNAMAKEQDGGDNPDATPAVTLKWTDNKEVGDDGLVADAYEIRTASGGDMMQAMAQMAIFGQNKRGFLATTDHAVVMTFSQRPAVLKAAINAVNGGDETLADDATLESVARWMGQPAPIEVFINLGQINKFAATAAKSMGPMTDGMDIPELDPKGPPMALQFGVGERSMTSTLAFPAPLLTDILREFERAFRPFTGADVDAQ